MLRNVSHNYLIHVPIVMILLHMLVIIVLSRVRGHVSQGIIDILEGDFTKDEMKRVVLHLSNDKSLSLDGLTNVFFKMYRN